MLVWDGTSDTLSRPTGVLVENNLIRLVGAGKADAHADAVVIDGAGKVLMPGLIDTHTHIALIEQNSTIVIHFRGAGSQLLIIFYFCVKTYPNIISSFPFF